MKTGTIVLLALAAAAVGAQPLKVYSEFVRLDPQGRPTAPASPREILSPAIARNAFTSFQVVVEVPEGTPWQLYIAQNPENAVKATLYREAGGVLERVPQPVAGSGTQTFWMDLWADRTAPVERIKVEPQLHIHEDWVIYPMEVRIMEAAVPEGPALPEGSAAPGEVMRGFLCGTKPAEGAETAAGGAAAGPALTIARLEYRNAQQDRALAAGVPREELQKRFGACDTPPPEDNPEWYFRVRDFLFR